MVVRKTEAWPAADITMLAYNRREPFAWAWLANEGHPASMGHIMMAERWPRC